MGELVCIKRPWIAKNGKETKFLFEREMHDAKSQTLMFAIRDVDGDT